MAGQWADKGGLAVTFTARYSSQCPACGERIHEGQQVRYEDDFVVHDDCPDLIDADAPRRTERKCPDCFTIHAGECL